MGVKGLWRLLLPIGRRISIETLEGRILAIDASIWLTQFIKANRDPETGAVRPGAHLVGFLRRICKLLYQGIRPVFVFDGATPEIKLREIRARRERREKMTIGIGGPGGGFAGGGGGDDDDGAIKRMARKLLVAELKRQKELKASSKANNNKKGSEGAASSSGGDGGGGAFSSNFNLDGDDEDEDGPSNNQVQEQSPSKGEEKKQSAEDDANADDSIIDLSELDDGAEYLRRGHNQEDHDQNDWDNPKPALFGSDDDSSTSSAASNGEVQIPEDEDQLDIDAVLSLPASQRKDIIEKAKKQQRLRSRKEFMPAAANPGAYSEVQLRNFLRSSNLNKKINEMGAKASRGEGVDGLKGEAIASDATRRFIFTKDSDKNKDKDNAHDGGGGGRKIVVAGHSGGAAMSSGAASQLDDTPSRRRHRLRRLGEHTHAADSDDDDDNIFGDESNAKRTHGEEAASGKAHPFYSSSDDDDDEAGGGGFLVEDDITNLEKGGSSDPKRTNYESHTHHDASGWSLDEVNVFGSTTGDRDSEASDDDGGGGGFLPKDTPNLSISRNGAETKSGGNDQVMEDEMLARALQEAEDEDAVVAESTVGGGILVGTTAHTKKRSRKNGNVSSRSQKEADAILAAQLEAEERNQGGDVGHRSEITDLSGSADKRSKVQGKANGGVVLLDSNSDNDSGDDDSDVEVLPPPGKRKRGGVRAKKPPVVVKSPPKDKFDEKERDSDDEDDAIAWEDGNTDEEVTAADTSIPFEARPKVATKAQSDLNSSDFFTKELDLEDDTGDGDIDWEDGDDNAAEPETETEPEVNVKANPMDNESPKAPSVDQSASDEEDDIVWEDGEGDGKNEATNEGTIEAMEVDDAKAGADTGEITDISRRNSSKSSLGENDGDFDGGAPNDFTVSPSNNTNLAALKHAEETAANLTIWAGRAVRRAIAAHMQESGAQESPQTSSHPTASASAKVSSVAKPDEVVIDDSSDASSDEELEDAITEVVRKETATGNRRIKPPETSAQAAPSIAQPTVLSQDRAAKVTESPSWATAAATATATATATAVTSKAASTAAAASVLMDTSLEALRMEHSQMQDELNRQQRDMDTVTDEMKEEIVQLLQLFGIPYIEAPAEAEAQACVLEALGLVDGVVTEDSDAFVFGGKKIYKNIFDDQKYVEAYVASDAERDLGLGHNHMIALAMLLGGDYTEGVKGVGIVNGMEVLQAFDVSADIKSGLSQFRQWLDGFEPTDNVATRTPAEKEFHNKHRSARNRWIAPKDFPSPSVLTAYQKPVVDKSDARFSWGLPDIEALRTFCARKIGWPVDETDRVILPVIKALESAGTRQTRLESYFMRYEDDIKFANVKSKRLQSVLRKVKGSDNAEATNGKGKESTGTSNDISEEAEATSDNIEPMEATDAEASDKKRKSKSNGKNNKKPKSR